MSAEKQDIGLLLKAAAFAAHKHRDQRRKDDKKSPYINHPLALADMLVNEGGVNDIETLCAALLHDTIEDTQTTDAELREHFGEAITGIVLEVTDDKNLDKHVRKELQVEHAVKASPKARLVKLADKICNLRDMVDMPPADWSADHKREYLIWADRVVAGVRGTNKALELAFDEVFEHGMKMYPSS